MGADLADESTLAGSGLTSRLLGRASVRLQRTQRRCWQVQAEERPDSDPHSPDRAVSRNQEPQGSEACNTAESRQRARPALDFVLSITWCPAGSTVVLYASALLLIAFVVPRIVTMGMLGIERSLVTTLLGFEELLTQALFSAAKWVRARELQLSSVLLCC